ncbi:putative protein kinase RLK-Pelle-L-LEC family [Helianthus annuus]|nr:putative protein kinase RLK-Pelle-L-LEC family [Helianthus annuus]
MLISRLMSIITCLFLALIPYASSITFNFTNITPKNSHDFLFSRDAAITPSDGIHLTNMKSDSGSESLAGPVGRVTYFKSLHLWEKDSNDLASFSTSFTFVINDLNANNFYADGFAFFLAQNNSMINSGRSLGLPFNVTTNTSMCPFVAVEFDTFGDDWDPVNPNTMSKDDHVGININSLTSAVSSKWNSNMTYGKECKALIEYNSESKNLSVSFTNFNDNNSRVWETGIYYIIDLRGVLPEWVIFGFSASTEDRSENNTVISWTLNSTEFEGGENNGSTPTFIPNNTGSGLPPTLSPEKTVRGSNLPPTMSPDAVKEGKNKLRKVALVVGMFVLVPISTILAIFLWRRKKTNVDKVAELGLSLEMKNEFENGPSMPRRLSYHELAQSTSYFAETEKLGEGGFRGVYKGFLKDLSMHVAVKRVSKTSKQGIEEYASEVRIISRLRHRYLVQLTGWCHDKGELLLAYEFMENGSLDLHLFKGKNLLKWNTRYKIARGLASALLYLHEEWEQCVLHRDIKSSNVMLDANFNAKLGDFGLAKLVDHEKGSQTTMLAGTLGYMAPECVVTGRATKESDVFSFGVVALEIACGRKAIDYKTQANQMRLIEWVWELYGTGSLLEAVDPSLGSDYEEEEIKILMILGLWCVHPDSELRPSIRQALKALNSEASLPLLPSKMPVASYLTPPISSLSDFSSISKYEPSSSI